MNVLFLDCSMGAAGDMLTAALSELLPDKNEFINELNALGIPGVEYSAEDCFKCGIKGTHITVKINGAEESEEMHSGQESHAHHHGHCFDEIKEIINSLNISDYVKTQALNVYRLIAEAESKVHGKTVEEIHFHEVGTMDAVADVVGVCLAVEKLNPDRIISTPVNVGSGQVHCAHGILPVPAPATANLLTGIPSYSDGITGELCTPTGAALLRNFVSEFSDMPVLKIESVGYGMGTKDFERANCVRAIYGKADKVKESVVELSCNLDDITGEELGFAIEALLKEGAKDVYAVPAVMKKSRPGYILNVICSEDDKERMVFLIFRHTTTIGIREAKFSRYTLDRKTETVDTEFGKMNLKISEGYGVVRKKFEYDDLASASVKYGLGIKEIEDKIK